MKYFLFLLSLILSNILISQKQTFFDDYTLSKCEGDIPEKILSSVKDKVIVDKSNATTEKTSDSKFLYNTYYHLDRLLKSGKILFGDEMTTYVAKVGANLLEKSEKSSLINEVSFFVLKSDKVNAFAMHDGSIFVTVGLLAQIENEAQLAFVLAHEIAHYEKKHNFEGYKESQNAKNEYGKTDDDFKSLLGKLSNYSKEKEFEADKIGYKTFKKAGYAVDEAVNMMYVMQYSHLPFDEIKFDPTFFNSNKYKLPTTYLELDKATEIKDGSEVDDTYSSHPNIDSRIKKIESFEKSNSTTSFFLSKDLFKYINTKARFENQYLSLIGKNFFRVVYESFLLKKDYPKNKYLDVCLAKGLYGMSKVKTNAGSFSNYIKSNFGDQSSDFYFEGESKVIVQMFFEMNRLEMNVLALKYLLKLNEEKYNIYIDGLIRDMVREMKFDYKKFVSDVEFEVTDTTNVSDTMKLKPKKKTFNELDSVEYAKLSKIGKIKYKKKKIKWDAYQLAMEVDTVAVEKQDEKKENDYYLTAFFKELKDTSFYNKFSRFKKEKGYRYFTDWYNDMSYVNKLSYSKKKKKKNYRNEKLYFDSLIVLNPNYSYVNKRPVLELNVKKSILLKSKFVESLNNSIEKYDKSVCSFINSNKDSLTLLKLNQEFAVKEWLEESRESFEYKMIPISQNNKDEKLKSIGYNKFLISGVVSFRTSILFGKTFRYIKIIDKDGYLILFKYLELRRIGNTYIDTMFIDDIFSQISNKK